MTGMENIVKSVLHFHICQEALLQTELSILVTCYPVFYERHMNVFMSAGDCSRYEYQVFFDKTVYKSVDKKNQLDVTFCILYFSSNSCSTCFGQPCAHHQELTTA